MPGSCKTTAFFLDEPGLLDDSAPNTEARRRLLAQLRASGLAQKLDMRGAPMAGVEDLLRIHPAAYLESFEALSAAGGGELGDFAPFGPGGYELARRSAGLVMQAVDEVLSGRYRHAYALARPGHHCLPDMPMGYCLLANIPVAIEAARARHGLERVAVLDWDVHHGNGTQAIYYGRSDVLTISLHQDGGFPAGYNGVRDRGEGEGLGFNINVPLLPGGGHDAFVYAMERIVTPAIERFEPELILVAAGYGANAMEPLARMLLHSESFRVLTGQAMALADGLCNGRLVMVHEGGAAEAYVPSCGHAVLQALSGAATALEDPLLALIEAQQANARQQAFQRGLIDEMALGFGV